MFSRVRYDSLLEYQIPELLRTPLQVKMFKNNLDIHVMQHKYNWLLSCKGKPAALEIMSLCQKETVLFPSDNQVRQMIKLHFTQQPIIIMKAYNTAAKMLTFKVN